MEGSAGCWELEGDRVGAGLGREGDHSEPASLCQGLAAPALTRAGSPCECTASPIPDPLRKAPCSGWAQLPSEDFSRTEMGTGGGEVPAVCSVAHGDLSPGATSSLPGMPGPPPTLPPRAGCDPCHPPPGMGSCNRERQGGVGWQERTASQLAQSPILVLSPWPQLLKCHFLSGPQQVCVRAQPPPTLRWDLQPGELPTDTVA